MKRLKLAFSALIGFVLCFPFSAAVQYSPLFGSRSPVSYDQAMTVDRIQQHLISALIGACAGAFFSEKFKKFRLYLFISGIILMLFAGALMNVTLGNIAAFIAAAVGAYIALREDRKTRAGKRVKPTTFGSAEWATFEHLQENGLIGQDGFFLGNFAGSPLQYAKDRHLLTVAPTRSGKGTTAIIPNLLLYNGSCIVIDPKGENARITAARRGAGDKEKNIPEWGKRSM